MIASELIARITVQGADKAMAALEGVGAASDNAGAKLGIGLAVGAAGAGAALVGIGIAAAKMAGDFQQEVNRMKTGGGDIQDSFSSLWSGIQKVSVATGVLTKPLSDAMYLIVSSGQRGAQAMDTLSAAAQGAQIEMANVSDVTQILTTIQTNFGLKTYTAAQYMDGLISAVSHGKITLQDLSTAMSPILPMAHELGIHFSDVSAALADMTNQGVPADRAAQALRFTMQSLIQPTKASRTAMAEWGLDSAKAAETMKTSLPDALQMYVDAAKHAGAEGTQPFIDALGSMVGGGTRAGQALWALSQSMGVWKQDIKDVNTAMGDTNKDVAGWTTAQSNLNIQLDQGKARLETMAQNLGAKLLPIATQFVGYLTTQMLPRLNDFSDWFGTYGVPAIQQFGAWFQQNATPALEQFGQKVLDVVTTGVHFVQFLHDASPAAQLLTGAALALAGAITAVKIAGLVGDFASFVGAVPGIVSKFFLVQSAAEAAAGAQGIAGIGTAATGAEATVATAATAMGLSLAGVIAIAAAAAVVGVLLVKHAIDTYNKNLAEGFAVPTPASDATSRFSTVSRSSAVHDALVQAAKDAKALQINIDQAWKDMESLGEYAASHKRILGDITDPLALNTADVKLQEIKTHADDLTKPRIIPIITTDIEKARLKVIEFKTRVDDLKGPVNVGVLTPEVVAARQKTIEFKSHVDDLKGPVNVGVTTPQVTAAGTIADQTRAKLIAMNGPYSPVVNTGSVVAAGNTADQTRNKLLNLNGGSTWNAYVNTYNTTYWANIGAGPGNVRAAGGLITEPVVGIGLRTGQRWSFGENGNEMVVPLGGQAAQSSGGGGSGQPIIINVNLAGHRVAQALLPDLAQSIRVATGAKF
jgi:TP901 family phage tail tape measure protein